LHGLVLLLLRLELPTLLASGWVQAQHRCRLPLLLHTILQHACLLVLRQHPAVPVVSLLLLLVELLGVADVACKTTWQQDTLS
jgi:hypothetical protein